MASKRIKGLSALPQAIAEVLEEYQGEVYGVTREVVVDCAKKGVEAVKAESKQFNPKNAPKKGRYYTGWTYIIDEDRLHCGAVLHNQKYGGMVHLLEKGHALRIGGRTYDDTNAFPHALPVQEMLDELFEREIVANL